MARPLPLRAVPTPTSSRLNTRSSHTARAERIPSLARSRMRAAADGLPPSTRTMTWRKAFWQFIWPRRKNVLIGLVLIVVSRAAGLVLPGSTKYLMDDVVAGHDMGMLKLLWCDFGQSWE